MQQMKEVISELELIFGDSVHEILTKLNSMNKEELIGYADALSAIHNYIVRNQYRLELLNQDEYQSSGHENILTPEEIDSILEQLELKLEIAEKK
jgi:hypothetical protein